MKEHRIKPGSEVDLTTLDPGGYQRVLGHKAQATKKLQKLDQELDRLQELLYAEHKHKLLIVLQGMDTSGKDGTIRRVFEGVNPQGVCVASFKVPTPEELDHDYLWRVHQQVPGKGQIVIFNRSHYEDVLVVRVHELVPKEIWGRRYAEINDFERLLAEEGTTILKFYLHIDPETQKERLQERLDEPTKRWKFNPDDLKERKLWGEYMKAYQDVLSRTSTEWAPWYAVPANHPWYRNLVVATTIVDTLAGLDMKYPEPSSSLEGIVIE